MNAKELVTCTLGQLAAEYRSAAIEYGVAIGNGRHRVANRHHDAVFGIGAELSARGQLAEALTPLLNDPEPAVRLCAAASCLESTPVESVEVLQQLAAERTPVGLMAHIALTEAKDRHG